jgi:hypothetical protein
LNRSPLPPASARTRYQTVQVGPIPPGSMSIVSEGVIMVARYAAAEPVVDRPLGHADRRVGAQSRSDRTEPIPGYERAVGTADACGVCRSVRAVEDE